MELEITEIISSLGHPSLGHPSLGHPSLGLHNAVGRQPGGGHLLEGSTVCRSLLHYPLQLTIENKVHYNLKRHIIIVKLFKYLM